jgi:hypothetical protein
VIDLRNCPNPPAPGGAYLFSHISSWANEFHGPHVRTS